MNLAYGQGGLQLEINIPPQHILAKSKGGLIIEGGVSSSEYGSCMLLKSSPAHIKAYYKIACIASLDKSCNVIGLSHPGWLPLDSLII